MCDRDRCRLDDALEQGHVPDDGTDDDPWAAGSEDQP